MGAQAQPALSGPALESAREAPQQQKLAWEKELLGIYLSEHPFTRAAEELRSYLSCGIVEVNAELAGRDVIIGGIIAGTRSLSTRDGRSFLAAEIEDLTGSLEVTVWPETYEQTREAWQTGNLVVANVKVKARDDRLQVSVQRVAVYGEGAFDPAALMAESNGNGRGANGHPDGRSKRNGNGGTGDRRQATGAAPAAPFAAGSDAAALRIVLEETDDPDGDHERLRALVNALRDYSGEGEVRLSIRQRDSATSLRRSSA
jgi:DNA polymerase-3 subunit alpha